MWGAGLQRLSHNARQAAELDPQSVRAITPAIAPCRSSTKSSRTPRWIMSANVEALSDDELDALRGLEVELLLLSVNVNFVAFSRQLGDAAGQVFVFFILTVAAAEAAIGLAILVIFFRRRGSIAVDDVNRMHG